MSFEGKVTMATGRPRASQAWIARRDLDGMFRILPALLIVAAIVQQVVIGLDTDVSWLLTVGERVVGGDRLYVDIFEVNPPASVLIYLPGILIAKAFGLTSEFATASLLFLLAVGSFWSASKFLHGANLLRREQIWPTLCAAIFAFLLLPGACFAQREHIAVLTLLPFITVLAVRMEGRSLGFAAALPAGLGAGITMAIKPHFVMAVVPLIAFAMWRRRSIAALIREEVWAALAIVMAYGLVVLTIYPVYLSQALPLLKAVYLPTYGSFSELWLSPAALIFFVSCALTLFLTRSEMARSRALLPSLAALGFAAAMVVQGKGYLNHSYPFVALGLFALTVAIVERNGDRTEKMFGAGVLLLLAGSSAFLFAHAQTYPEVAQLIRRVAPQHPRIMVAGSNLSVGHPLTRWVGGQWVGRRGALWVTGTAVALLDKADDAERAVLNAYIAEDRRIFVEDVELGRPDVILVPGTTGWQWIRSNPDVARVLAPYRSGGSAHGVEVMIRKPEITPGNRG